MRTIHTVVPFLLAAPLTVSAVTVTPYSTEAGFFAAAGAGATLATETFSGLTVGLTYSALFSATTPSIAAGVDLTPGTGSLFATGAPGSTALSVFDLDDAISGSFAAGTTAVGSLVFSENFSGLSDSTLVITVSGTDSGGTGFSEEFDVAVSAAGPLEYFGVIVQDGTIDDILWDGPSTAFAGIDDLSFGTADVNPIPIPATWLLLLPALGLLAHRRRAG